MAWPLTIAAALLTLFILLGGKWRRYHRRTPNPESQDLTKPRPIDITVLFTNLNDFVTLFSDLGDQAGAALLNEYYALMTPIIRKHRGFLCEYQFDSIFCFFGPIFTPSDDNHAATALDALLEIQTAFDRWNKTLAENGRPQLTMRAGLATGTATVGNIGSLQFTQFTAIGPAVTLAKQLERACKQTSARHLASAETKRRTQLQFTFRAIELKDKSIEAFEASPRPG